MSIQDSTTASVPFLPTLATVLVVSFALYKYIVYPAFLTPLARIPNAHPLAPTSSLWILWIRHQFKENATLFAAHKKHGPVVRLGPNEVSVNCVDGGIKTIYAGNFDKHQFYPNLFSNYKGVPTMFSTAESTPHSHRKRMISNLYSKSSVQRSETMAAASSVIILRRFLPKLKQHCDSQEYTDVMFLFNCVFMDMVTAYQFGLKNSANFLQNEDTAKWWLECYQSRKRYTFWPQEMPNLTSFMARFGILLSPQWVADANSKLEEWCLGLCDTAEAHDKTVQEEPAQEKAQDVPVIYRQLKQSLDKERGSSKAVPLTRSAEVRLQVASELLDELSAGHETSAITMTFMFHELAQRPSLQQDLKRELLAVQPPIHSNGEAELPAPKDIDALPLLNAIVMETLRRHAAIPGPQPRVTPSNAMSKLGIYAGLPGNVRVSANAHCLHREPAVFPEPDQWRPERWLTEEGASERSRWFWAFGSGGRMCIGSNLAMQSMKLVVAATLSSYLVEMEEGTRLVQEDAYTAYPEEKKLMLKFVEWSALR